MTNTPTQSEGEDRDTVIGAVFALMLERKSKEYADLTTFLKTIGMSLGSYYNLLKGVGNPTFWTVERTARALGLSAWDMLGVDAKVMKAWLAGQNIDVEKVQKRVEERRHARQGFSLDDFSVEEQAGKAMVDDERPGKEGPKPASSVEHKSSAPRAPTKKGRKAVKA